VRRAIHVPSPTVLIAVSCCLFQHTMKTIRRAGFPSLLMLTFSGIKGYDFYFLDVCHFVACFVCIGTKVPYYYGLLVPV
jgi:hypothetical protein